MINEKINFCINVICKNKHSMSWMAEAIKYLEMHFNYNDINFKFIEDLKYNIEETHPSWYKLLLHKHNNYEYDYILCWDLDLLPTNKFAINHVLSEIHPEKFYLCRDTHLRLKHPEKYFLKIDKICENFRWNCGLFGIPKEQAKAMESIYYNNFQSNKPSWEQYHVADYLYKNQNIVVDGDDNNNLLIQSLLNDSNKQILHLGMANCLHYSMSDKNIREKLILEHCKEDLNLW